jgi:hypothetical protein
LESCILLQSLWKFFPSFVRLLETAKHLSITSADKLWFRLL